MNIKTLFCTLLLFLLLGICNTSAFATEYSTESHVFWETNGVTIDVLYTATTNSIGNIKLHKDYQGYSAVWYFYNRTSNTVIEDTPLGEHTKTMTESIFADNTISPIKPNIGYPLTVDVRGVYYNENGNSVWYEAGPAYTYMLYTDPETPTSLTFLTIGTEIISLRWNNQGNPLDTSYTLQRRLDGSDIWVDVDTQSGMYQYTDIGLANNTKYYYRVRVNGKNGGFIYSSEYNVTTAVDLAVTAAQQAATAANNANANAWNAVNNTTYSGQSAAYWAYLASQNSTADTTPPTISKVAGQSGATCTTTTTFNVAVTATDNKAGQLQAQAQVDGVAWGSWYNIPQNSIPVTLSTSGAHMITVQVKDATGNISSSTMTAFKI